MQQSEKLKLDKFLSLLEILYNDQKFYRRVTVFALRLRNVLNTSSRLVNKNSLTLWYLLKTFWRHFCKTSWRCLKDVLKTSSKLLEDVLKMSWRRLYKPSWRRFEGVLKASPHDFLKIFWRRLQDIFARRLEEVLKAFWKRLGKTSWRHHEGVLKTSWRRLETYDQNECIGLYQGVLKTSSEEVRLRRKYSSW